MTPAVVTVAVATDARTLNDTEYGAVPPLTVTDGRAVHLPATAVAVGLEGVMTSGTTAAVAMQVIVAVLVLLLASATDNVITVPTGRIAPVNETLPTLVTVVC